MCFGTKNFVKNFLTCYEVAGSRFTHALLFACLGASAHVFSFYLDSMKNKHGVTQTSFGTEASQPNTSDMLKSNGILDEIRAPGQVRIGLSRSV